MRKIAILLLVVILSGIVLFMHFQQGFVLLTAKSKDTKWNVADHLFKEF